MPIYEYRCTQCNEHTEKLQKLSDAPLTQCPHCDAKALTKLISNTSFRLKGTGWYETDFKQSPTTPKPAEKKTEPAEKSATNKKDAS